MIFHYHPVMTMSPVTGEPNIILRPEIPVTLIGPKRRRRYRALLDTGADNTIIPGSMARRIGVEQQASTGSQAVAFGGGKLDVSSALVRFLLKQGSESVEREDTVLVYDLPKGEEKIVILGHQGFFDYFTANFDGQLGMSELIPNDTMPGS
jgi:predicted aspartyl protease